MEHKTICIDLGHCETTAAFPEQIAANDADAVDNHVVRRLNTKDKDQVISTQIILTAEQMEKLSGHPRPDYQLICSLGAIRIGNGLPVEVPNGEKFSYFKLPPIGFDTPCGESPLVKTYGITHGMVMACFAAALISSILKHNDSLSEADREELTLLIGCPTTSDWMSEEAQRAYAQLVQTATNVREVRIIPESRAAMFSSVENGQGNVSAMNGAVVFDFGSSTADCTYMLLGRKMMEFSWTLGASEIEKIMVRRAYDNATGKKGAFSATTESIVNNLDVLRTAKEGYYNGSYGSTGHRIYNDFRNAANGELVESSVRVDDPFMQQVTGEQTFGVLRDSTTLATDTWQGHCTAFFQEAHDRIAQASYQVTEGGTVKHIPCPIQTVVLTGGASKMGFILELCQRVFPDAEIIQEENPSHTVSNGLGWVAVADENVKNCKDAALQQVKNNQECSTKVLRDMISGALFQKICDIAVERTKAWADDPAEELPVEALQNDLTAYTSSEEVQAELRGVCQEQMDAWKAKLSLAMQEAINSQVNRIYSDKVAAGMVIPGDIWAQLQSGALSLESIDIGKSLTGIDFSGIARQVGKNVIQLVIWAAAMVLAIPTGGASALVAWVLDKLTNIIMTDKDLKKPRDKKQRTQVADGLRPKLTDVQNDVMEKFNASLAEQTSSFMDVADGTLTKAFEIVTLKRFDI